MTQDPDRRDVLALMLASVLGVMTGPGSGRLAAATTSSLPLDRSRFLALSSIICDMPAKGGAAADAIQLALTEQHPEGALAQLAALLKDATPGDVERLLAGSPLQALGKDLQSIWYSGFIGTGKGQRAVVHEEALAWRATGYAKAPAVCGEFGTWTDLPAIVSAGGAKP